MAHSNPVVQGAGASAVRARSEQPPQSAPQAQSGHEEPRVKPARPVRRAGSRLVPILMLLAGYAFAFWALGTVLADQASLPAGYKYVVVLTAVPFLLAAHGFAIVRWGQLRRLDELQGTIRDLTTDVSLSAWEIFFCWLGICASLMFLYYAAPIADLNEWYPRLFLILVVFFGATFQKALVFSLALLPFVMTLSALAVWTYNLPGGSLLSNSYDTAAAIAFLAVDVALLSWAVRLVKRHGGFRICELQMPLGSAQVGNVLAGVIRTRQKEMPESGFHVHLSCLRQFKTGKRGRQGQVLWHAEKVARGDLPGARHTDTSVPVTFKIPSNVPPTSVADENDRVTWTLRAKASLPETDFSCAFEVPVEQTGEPPALPSPAHLTHSPGAQPPVLAGRAASTAGGGTRFRFSSPWNRATELITAAYFLFWFQLVWLATSHRLTWETWVMFGVGVWFLALVVTPWMSKTDVQLQDGLLKVTNRVLGIKRTRVIVPRQVQNIKVRAGRLRTGLVDGLDYYDLHLEEDTGRVVVVGRHIRDREAAHQTAEEMKQVIAHAAGKPYISDVPLVPDSP